MFRPIEDHHSDEYILKESKFIDVFRAACPEMPYVIYEDTGLALCKHIIVSYTMPSGKEKVWNYYLAHHCIPVEWEFGEILKYCGALDYKWTPLKKETSLV